jgi:hypothetical protein
MSKNTADMSAKPTDHHHYDPPSYEHHDPATDPAMGAPVYHQENYGSLPIEWTASRRRNNNECGIFKALLATIIVCVGAFILGIVIRGFLYGPPSSSPF